MTKKINLTTAEEKLSTLIWQYTPLTSPELVELAEQNLEWKKSTTYTILKKLCDKGVFRNDNTNISVILTRDELIALKSRHFVEDVFGGSLPGFITSFFGGKKLTSDQAEELRRLINEYERGNEHG